MQIVHAPKAPKAIGPYSQAVIHNGFMFASGQIPLDPETMNMVEGGVVEQMKQVIKNVDALLEGAKTSKEHVMKVTLFLKNMGDFAAVNEVYAAYFGDHKPARSTIEVARLPKDALVEMEVIVTV